MDLQSALHNIRAAKRFAFDIGSRVTRLVYTSKVSKLHSLSKNGEREEDGTQLHCIHFPHSDLQEVCNYIAQNVDLRGKKIPFASTHTATEENEGLIRETLGVELTKVSDIDCLVQGTNFLLKNILDEVYVYDHHNEACRYFFRTILHSPHASLYPYVLVNVGTGMSIVLVESEHKFTHIGGSHCGGGSFFGLGRLLTGVSDIDELLRMAEDGDHRKVDSLVCDIYGSNYNINALGLNPDIIAGSFGKCSNPEFASEAKKSPDYKKDVIRSLLLMISNQIGQVVSLLASNSNTSRIFFNGYMVRNHPIIMRTISYALNFWTQGSMEAHFLRHEDYTAAIGALVNGWSLLTEEEKSHNVDVLSVSWREHYAGCSDLGRFVPKQPIDQRFRAGVLELDCTDIVLHPFPLLAKGAYYVPDTVDLNTDLPARNFWISIMEESVRRMATKAAESQLGSPTAKQRAAVVAEKYLEQLRLLQEKPFAYGTCNVRNLLDLREQIFNEQEFDDPFFAQKTLENKVAVRELVHVLEALDSMEHDRERLAEACRGLLAGNVFDWGAKEVVKLLEGSEEFTFDKAKGCIPARPWLIDTMDLFLEDSLAGKHKSVAIFVDNSGPDVILGVLPFARELLKSGAKVIVVCNLHPALNDITYNELMALMEEIVHLDSLLGEAYSTGQLKIWHSGQGSPCLDLRRVDKTLCDLVVENDVDLVVIEGMGRALHTNFDAKFSVNCLKAAVIKTQWLADRMGGDIFSVVCKYETPQ